MSGRRFVGGPGTGIGVASDLLAKSIDRRQDFQHRLALARATAQLKQQFRSPKERFEDQYYTLAGQAAGVPGGGPLTSEQARARLQELQPFVQGRGGVGRAVDPRVTMRQELFDLSRQASGQAPPTPGLVDASAAQLGAQLPEQFVVTGESFPQPAQRATLLPRVGGVQTPASFIPTMAPQVAARVAQGQYAQRLPLARDLGAVPRAPVPKKSVTGSIDDLVGETTSPEDLSSVATPDLVQRAKQRDPAAIAELRRRGLLH